MFLGVDIGFYEVKAVGNGRRVHFPSFATGARHSLLSLNGNDRILVQSQEQDFMMGLEAIRKGTGARKETSEWIESPEYLALFHGTLSEITEATQAGAIVVTGLPIGDVGRDKSKLKGRLMGVHAFTREGRRGQRITVDHVRVVPQGWGAVLALLFDDRGNVARRELDKQKVGVIDVGGHNVQYLAVDGLSDLPTESRSTERGAWNVMRAVRDHLDAAHPGLSRLADHQVMGAAIAREVYDQHRRVDLEPIVKPIIADIGQEIVDTAGQYWGPGAATFRAILVCGGGAYLWGEHIKAAFPQAVVLERPEFANAQGYHNFAAYLGQKERAHG